MKQLLCENNSRGSSSSFVVPYCLCVFIKWNNISRQRVLVSQPSGTNFPEKATDCLEQLLKWNKIPWLEGKLPVKIEVFIKCNCVSTANHFHKRNKNWILLSHYSVEKKISIHGITNISPGGDLVIQWKLLTTEPRLLFLLAKKKHLYLNG